MHMACQGQQGTLLLLVTHPLHDSRAYLRMQPLPDACAPTQQPSVSIVKPGMRLPH